MTLGQGGRIWYNIRLSTKQLFFLLKHACELVHSRSRMSCNLYKTDRQQKLLHHGCTYAASVSFFRHLEKGQTAAGHLAFFERFFIPGLDIQWLVRLLLLVASVDLIFVILWENFSATIQVWTIVCKRTLSEDEIKAKSTFIKTSRWNKMLKPGPRPPSLYKLIVGLSATCDGMELLSPSLGFLGFKLLSPGIHPLSSLPAL